MDGAVLIVVMMVNGALAGDVITKEFDTAAECLVELDQMATKPEFQTGACIDQVTGTNIASVDNK